MEITFDPCYYKAMTEISVRLALAKKCTGDIKNLVLWESVREHPLAPFHFLPCLRGLCAYSSLGLSITEWALGQTGASSVALKAAEHQTLSPIHLPAKTAGQRPPRQWWTPEATHPAGPWRRPKHVFLCHQPPEEELTIPRPWKRMIQLAISRTHRFFPVARSVCSMILAGVPHPRGRCKMLCNLGSRQGWAKTEVVALNLLGTSWLC